MYEKMYDCKYCKQEDIEKRIRGVLSLKRADHSVGVAVMAAELAKVNGINPARAYTAGLLHDCGKYMDGAELLAFCISHNIKTDRMMLQVPELLHGAAGAYLAKEEYKCNDQGILFAILNHTLGRKNMNIIEKIVFVADFCEKGSKYEGADSVRALSFKNIDRAVVKTVNLKIGYLIYKNAIIHPRILDTRNFILSEMEEETW